MMDKPIKEFEKIVLFLMGGVFFILINVQSNGYLNSVVMDTITDIHNYHYDLDNIDITNISSNDEYETMIKQKFIYNKSTTNCQYWSAQWEEYADKFNYTYRYITIPNHVFGIMYTNNSYCIIDQKSKICNV